MRQRSSPPSDSLPQSLHPVLQAALDSLDVELEEELMRYRRQRYRQAKHGKHIPIWQPTRPPEARSPQLPLMDKSQRSPVAPSPEPPRETLPQSELTAVSIPAVVPPSTVEFNTASLPLMAPLFSAHPETQRSDKTLDRLRELAIAATTFAEEQTRDPQLEIPRPEFFQPEIPQPEFSETAVFAPDDRSRSGFSDPLDDYLESTEELLQSIAEEPHNLPVERESSLLDSLLTPLGIGSMVLLLLSSATLGYVIMHPSSLDLLNPPETASSQGTTGDSPNSGSFTSPMIPDSPNLAAEEFVDLNVNNLSTIPGKAGNSPVAGNPAMNGAQGQSLLPSVPNSTSSPQDPQQPSQIAVDTAPEATTEAETPSSTVESIPAPEAEQQPATPEPEPVSESYEPPVESAALPAIESPPPAISASESSPPAPAPEVATAPAGNYYVVTPYNGDSSLEQARQTVPDAYVRNFEAGASVQLGVFNSAENAQELVQELESKGIAAEIYQP